MLLLFSCWVVSDSLQSMDCSTPGSSVHGILENTGVDCHFLIQGIFPDQRLNPHLLHWQADSLSPSSQRSHIYVCVCECVRVLSSFSRVWLFVTIWPVAHQGPLSMGFSRQEYWNGLLCPPSGDLPDPGIEPTSFTSPTLAGGFFTTSATWEAHIHECVSVCLCVCVYTYLEKRSTLLAGIFLLTIQHA